MHQATELVLKSCHSCLPSKLNLHQTKELILIQSFVAQFRSKTCIKLLSLLCKSVISFLIILKSHQATELVLRRISAIFLIILMHQATELVLQTCHSCLPSKLNLHQTKELILIQSFVAQFRSKTCIKLLSLLCKSVISFLIFLKVASSY